MDFTGTKRIAGREAASQIAAASLASFLPVGTLAAVGRHELCAHQPRQQAQRGQCTRPVVGARADLHGHDAARRQLRTPGDELVARQGAATHHAAGRIDCVHLDDSLGQVGADANDRAASNDHAGFTCSTSSCNLLHGLPLSTLSD